MSPLTCEGLAFVPRGRSSPFEGDVRCEVVRDLLVDRYEVTRALWQAAQREDRRLPAAQREDRRLPDLNGRLGVEWRQGEEQLPATGMTFAEAERMAAVRGMRLPTVGEWMYVAAGSRAQFWPHGNLRQTSVANTAEVRLGRPAAVGTFPNGRTSGTGVYDMLGNVWEWASPPLPERIQPLQWWVDGPSPWPVWAMGGSYLTAARPLYGTGLDGKRRVFHARGLDSERGGVDVGLRCVVDAEVFVASHAAAWSRVRWRDRVAAVGRSWGPRAVPMLARLAEDPGAPPAIRWLLEGALG